MDKLTYKPMPSSQLVTPLSKREYKFIYDNMQNKETYMYIDENKNINFLLKCSNNQSISILKSKKSIYIDKYKLGVSIEINFLDNDDSVKFLFDVYNTNDFNILNSIVKERKPIIITFVTKEKSDFFKVFHIDLLLEDGLIERINYLKNAAYDLQYPRIENSNEGMLLCNYLEYEFNADILEDILMLCDNLTKWRSVDDFEVHLCNIGNLRLYFLGTVKNYNYIKNYLGKKYVLTSEGKQLSRGTPFVKYKNGYIYFFNNKKYENNKKTGNF